MRSLKIIGITLFCGVIGFLVFYSSIRHLQKRGYFLPKATASEIPTPSGDYVPAISYNGEPLISVAPGQRLVIESSPPITPEWVNEKIAGAMQSAESQQTVPIYRAPAAAGPYGEFSGKGMLLFATDLDITTTGIDDLARTLHIKPIPQHGYRRFVLVDAQSFNHYDGMEWLRIAHKQARRWHFGYNGTRWKAR